MRVCPQCGEAVTPGERTCGLCGAEIPAGRPLRLYLASAASLAALLIAAALLHSYLETRTIRPPTDFLPNSAVAVIGLDLRPGGPAKLLLETTWDQSDTEILADRAVELAQRGLDWTGLQLDLAENASDWFGGEALVASVKHSSTRALSPKSLVLIARATDPRRARSDLDRSVAELAREAGWERSVRRADGHTIVVWGQPNERSEIAYAALDGCVLLAASEELVELCLETAQAPSRSLIQSEEFKETVRLLPPDAFLWCYASAPDLLHAARTLLPELRRGWLGLAKAYLWTAARPPSEGPSGGTRTATGSVAFALTPEGDGLRLHANYWRGPTKATPASTPDSAKLLDLVPRDAAAFALVRGFPALVSSFLPSPDRTPRRRAFVPFGLWDPLGFLLQEENLPESILLTVLPRDDDAHPVAIAAALSGTGAAETARRLHQLLPKAVGEEIEGVQVFAADAEGLRQFQQAAHDEAARLDILTRPDVRLQAWARPGELWPALDKIGDLGFTVRENATGAQADLHLKAEPRYLLGGP